METYLMKNENRNILVRNIFILIILKNLFPNDKKVLILVSVGSEYLDGKEINGENIVFKKLLAFHIH